MRALIPKPIGQRLDFTCGPACVLYSLVHFGRSTDFSFTEELDVWREANIVFAASGSSGCCAEGLAYSLVQRGLGASVLESHPKLYFDFTVRDPGKKSGIIAATDQLAHKAREAGVGFLTAALDEPTLDAALARGSLVILLVRLTYRLTERTPHWIVLTGKGDGRYRVWDPYGLEDKPGSFADLEVPYSEIAGHAFFRRGRFSAVFVGPE